MSDLQSLSFGNDPKHTENAWIKTHTHTLTHYQSWIGLDYNITEAVWDDFDSEENERQPTSKRRAYNVPGNYS